MPVRSANAEWNGTLKAGKGTMSTESGAYQGSFSFGTRFGDEKGTNPDELLGAALAGCFSMALSLELEQAGAKPESVRTSAKVSVVQVEGGFAIKSIDLDTQVKASGIDQAKFQEVAHATKDGCPVSKALTGVEKKLSAKLLS